MRKWMIYVAPKGLMGQMIPGTYPHYGPVSAPTDAHVLASLEVGKWIERAIQELTDAEKENSSIYVLRTTTFRTVVRHKRMLASRQVSGRASWL
jgi:hypothetical protein